MYLSHEEKEANQRCWSPTIGRSRRSWRSLAVAVEDGWGLDGAVMRRDVRKAETT
jgi:hypothetical protein